jgi:hypothetical protein
MIRWKLAIVATTLSLIASAAQIPKFEPDPSWPKPLPNNWMLGQVSGTSVDSHDHIWVLHRPRTMEEHDRYGETGKGDCCVPAPAVIEFDQVGNVTNGPITSTVFSSIPKTMSGSPVTAIKTRRF